MNALEAFLSVVQNPRQGTERFLKSQNRANLVWVYLITAAFAAAISEAIANTTQTPELSFVPSLIFSFLGLAFGLWIASLLQYISLWLLNEKVVAENIKELVSVFALIQAFVGITAIPLFLIEKASLPLALVAAIAWFLFVCHLSIRSTAQVFGIRGIRVVLSYIVQGVVLLAIFIAVPMFLGFALGLMF